MDLDTVLQLAGSSLRLATPLLLACLAGLFSERAGISKASSAPPW